MIALNLGVSEKNMEVLHLLAHEGDMGRLGELGVEVEKGIRRYEKAKKEGETLVVE